MTDGRRWRLVAVLVALILAISFTLLFVFYRAGASGAGASGKLITSVEYVCDQGRTVSAEFYQGPASPGSASTPPTPGGSVILTMDDGRHLQLSQTISADGARYANADESFVFWEKGKTAFIQENGIQTWSGCRKMTQSRPIQDR